MKGHNKPDQEFFAAYGKELAPVDNPEELDYNVRFFFTGEVEDIGSFWQIPDPERRCIGKAYVRDDEGRYVLDREGVRLSRPCMSWRMKGSTVCLKHGGGTKAARNAAKLRLLAAADSLVGHLLSIAFDKETSAKDRIAAINSALDRCDIKGGVEVSVELKPYERLLAEWVKESGVGSNDDVDEEE